MLTVDVVTNVPTPYNAALFRALSDLVDLRVHFEAPPGALRSWAGADDFLAGFDAVTHDGTRVGRWGFWTPGLARSLRRDADVLLLSGSYTSPNTTALLLQPPKGPGRLFWGERFMTTRPTNSWIRKVLLGRADFLLAIGAQAAQQYRSVTRAAVHVLPYVCAADEPVPEPSRERIGFVGQIIRRKGIDLLFEACSRAGGPDIDIVGSGPLEAELRQDAVRRGLNVTWHGECRNSAIRAIRSTWAFQVVPSRYDGWGVVVNEALASGTPVVVSSNTGAAELIRDGVNGWIYEGNDVRNLSYALQRARKCCADHGPYHAAAVTGRAFSAEPASAFLVDLLTTAGPERSFIREQWRTADNCLRRRLDPDDGVPHSVCGIDPPPR